VEPGKSMQELSEWDELKTFFDRRLIKAIGHPVREHILAVLNERIASAREIGEEIGADVSSFYHHIEELEKLECIERVETKRRRGVKEHFFRARSTLVFDETRWHALPPSIKADVAVSSLQYLFDDVADALEEGTLDARDDRHISWVPAEFDPQGWEEARDLIDQTLERLGAIQDAAALRLAKGRERGLMATVAMLAFETVDASSAIRRAGGREQRPRQASDQ
jgi:DNA-binding transcriptional ArsR family regulator